MLYRGKISGWIVSLSWLIIKYGPYSIVFTIKTVFQIENFNTTKEMIKFMTKIDHLTTVQSTEFFPIRRFIQLTRMRLNIVQQGFQGRQNRGRQKRRYRQGIHRSFECEYSLTIIPYGSYVWFPIVSGCLGKITESQRLLRDLNIENFGWGCYGISFQEWNALIY